MPQTPAVRRRPPSVQLRTLGCRLNQAESDEILEALAARGIQSAAVTPDVVVLNTCTVTAEASKASRKLIRRSIADHPHAEIVVTGCYAVAEPEVVAAIPGVDLVVSNQDKDHIASRIAGEPTCLSPFTNGAAGPRANLKIQTGCDEACSFCIVPQTRGRLSSRPSDDVVDAARRMVTRGVREVVLTGVHIAKYGWDLSDGPRLTDLIRRLGAVPGLERIRLSSIEASQINQELLETLASEPKACRHLHIPLQTGDPALWRAMRRPGTLDRFIGLAAGARRVIDDLTLTTDVMVGFPGENEPAFVNTLSVVEKVAFRKLHVFRFSRRAGTVAAADPRGVDAETARDRSERLRRLGHLLQGRWLQGQLGRKVRVLIEQARPAPPNSPGRPRLNGLTDNYLRVYTSGSVGLVGRTIEVLVTSVGQDSVEGDIVG